MYINKKTNKHLNRVYARRGSGTAASVILPTCLVELHPQAANCTFVGGSSEGYRSLDPYVTEDNSRRRFLHNWVDSWKSYGTVNQAPYVSLSLSIDAISSANSSISASSALFRFLCLELNFFLTLDFALNDFVFALPTRRIVRGVDRAGELSLYKFSF